MLECKRETVEVRKMDAIEAIQSRRSIRQYKNSVPERSLIEAIILDAAKAPPPFSGQRPWVFNVIEGRDRISHYALRAKQFAKEHRPEGPGWEWVDRLDNFEVFWNAPVLIIISGRVEDCCRAGQNLMLSAHARGLGTCWVGAPMLWLRDTETQKELRIPSGFAPVSAFCLGYPDEAPAPPKVEPPHIIWPGSP